jgi:hypothetical protein
MLGEFAVLKNTRRYAVEVVAGTASVLAGSIVGGCAAQLRSVIGFGDSNCVTSKYVSFPSKRPHSAPKTQAAGHRKDIHVGVCGGFVGVFSLEHPKHRQKSASVCSNITSSLPQNNSYRYYFSSFSHTGDSASLDAPPSSFCALCTIQRVQLRHHSESCTDPALGLSRAKGSRVNSAKHIVVSRCGRPSSQHKPTA